MAHDEQNDDERLLNLLEPQADASLPPGCVWDHPFWAVPVVEYRTAKRGNRLMKVMTDESRKRVLAWSSIKWTRFKHNDPDAIDAWQANALAVHAEQDRQRD